MSGGVDSTVAAYKLKQMGYEVIGVNMRLWKDDKSSVARNNSAEEDARRVCEQLGIPFHVVDFESLFRETVVDDFITCYKNGETPNPCVVCNRLIKFGALLDKAHELGAYYIATGHYSSVYYDEAIKRYVIEMASAREKDQTYAIYTLKQEQLQHVLMPLSDFQSKEEVRKIISEVDVRMSSKSDSQEICFIPDDQYIPFLERYGNLKDTTGAFYDIDGQVLGKHKGIIHYTVGQRKGLGLTFGKPMYVVDINPTSNGVVLGDNQSVFKKSLWARDVNFILFDKLEGPMKCEAKIRYSAKPATCTIESIGDELYVEFDEPQRAITPGQSVVFYQGNRLVGGGIIMRK